MSQQIKVMEGYLPMVLVPGVGPCVLVPTVGSVRYAGNTTLGEALTAINEQVMANAATVARNDVEVADMKAWLVEHLGYAPGDHVTGNATLTPLFAELDKVPSAAPDEAAPVEGGRDEH